MNVGELSERLSQLKSVDPLPGCRCFVERVAMRNAIHFFRPFADDIVHYTSVQNLPEDAAIALAVDILDTLARRWTEVAGKEVARLLPWSGGPAFADQLIVLGIGVARKGACEGYFLPSRTVAAFPVNHIEFTGEETAGEATVRMHDCPLNDMTRTPSPIVFARYRLTDGSGSAKHFGVGLPDTILGILSSVVRVGGRLEYENYERERCLLTTDAGTSRLNMRVGGVEHTVTHDQAIGFFHTMTLKGIAALMKEFG